MLRQMLHTMLVDRFKLTIADQKFKRALRRPPDSASPEYLLLESVWIGPPNWLPLSWP
jgi:hypothetical protein